MSSIKCILYHLEIALLHLDANVTGHDHGTWHGRSAASHDISLSLSPQLSPLVDTIARCRIRTISLISTQ
jgi:hypothetical protein